MKKRQIIFASGISLLLLSSCATKKHTELSTSSDSYSLETAISTTHSTTIATLESTEEVTESDPFETLSQEVQLVLMANTVDSRVESYPGLEGLTLYYLVDDKDTYLQITSGVGSGHPIYKLTLTKDGVTPIEGICYSGINGYELVEVASQTIPRETLLQTYNENKIDFDTAANNVQLAETLKETFDEQMSFVRSADTQPTDE
jgi:hypothetical protein